MNIKNLIKKLKKLIIETEGFSKISEIAEKGYLPLEELRDSNSCNLTFGERVLILAKNKRCDLITDELLENVNFFGWCEFWKEVVEKDIFIPCTLKKKMLVYFKEVLLDEIRNRNDISWKLDRNIFKDKQIVKAIIDVLKNLDVEHFGRLKKYIFPQDLLYRVYRERRKLLRAKGKGRKTYKNLLFEAIMENNYRTYVRSRVRAGDLSRDDFYTLVPHWLKCDVSILSDMMISPYFNELPEETRNSVILRCVNEDPSDTTFVLRNYNVNFDWQIIKHVKDATARREMVGIYLSRCCRQKLANEQINVDWSDFEAFLSALFVSDSRVAYYYYAALVIFEPKFVTIDDEEEKYFYNYLLCKKIDLYPSEHLLKLYELMLEIFAAGIPQIQYQRVLEQVANILLTLG